MHKALRFHLVIISLLLCSALVSAAINVIPTTEIASIRISKGLPLNQPSDVEVGPNGRIYLLDGVNNRVIVFSSSFDYITQFGKKGREEGRLWYPVGLTVDRRGNVFVADSGNHRINIYDGNGKFRSSFKLAWEKPLVPSDPTDLVIDGDTNNCYIVDNDNHRILVYSTDGKFNFSWGFKGRRKGEFRYPYSITMDSERNLCIVDVINSRVQVFNLKGEFIRQIGGWGVTPGTFYRPKGITADDNNRIYVAGSYVKFGNIQVFSNSGEFLGIIGNKQGKALKFTTPMGIYFDVESRKLFVVEMLANRVRIFKAGW